MKARYFDALIRWIDDNTLEEVTMKIGDVEEDDDEVFFYLESEAEIESFKKEGVEDFVIVEIKEI